MELSFLNRSYLRYLTHHLMERDSDTDTEAHKNRRTAFFGAILSLWRSVIENQSVERLVLMTDLIARSEFAHERHCGDLARLRTELFSLTDADVFRLYAVMFGMFKSEIISYPLWTLLADNFAALTLRVARKTDVSLVFNEEADAERFEAALCEALAEFALLECPIEDVCVRGENYPLDPPQTQPIRESSHFDDLDGLDCYVELTDAGTLSAMKNAACLAAYDTGEPERGIMTVGGFITFALPDMSDAVTVQITGRADYPTYEEMYTELGTAAFGYGDRSPAECAAKTEALYKGAMSHGPLCLRVKRLASPVLKVRDVEKLRKSGKGRLYYKRYRADDYAHAEWEPTLITDCCGLEVGNWYSYCPNCGKRIDIVRCKRGKTLLGGFEAEMFDYATWFCSCGRGCERYQYRFCPVCGKDRDQAEDAE